MITKLMELLDQIGERMEPHKEKIRLGKMYDMSPSHHIEKAKVEELEWVAEQITKIIKEE